MALIGSIEEIGITDILQLLALSQKTGILAVRNERNEEVGVLYFKEGRIAYGRLKAQNMKERLIQENRIQRMQLRKIEEGMEEGESFENALLRSKLVDVLDMRKYLREYAEDTIFFLCGQRTGTFQFERRVLPINPDLTLFLKTDSLIIESSRRIDEWTRIKEKLPPTDTVLELTPPHKRWRERNLKSSEAILLSLVEQGKSLREIYKVLGDDFTTAKTLQSLLEMRVVQVASPARGREHLIKGRKYLLQGEMGKALELLEQAVEEGVERKDAHLFLGDLLLRQRNFQKALQEYETAKRIDPQNPTVLSRLGYCYAKLGQISQAISCWENFMLLPFDSSIKERTEKVLKEARIFQRYLDETLPIPAVKTVKKNLKEILKDINRQNGVLGSMAINDTGLVLEKAIPDSDRVEEAAAFSASFLLLAMRSLLLLKMGNLERAVLDKGDWRIHLFKVDPYILVILTGSEIHLELQMSTFQRIFNEIERPIRK